MTEKKDDKLFDEMVPQEEQEYALELLKRTKGWGRLTSPERRESVKMMISSNKLGNLLIERIESELGIIKAKAKLDTESNGGEWEETKWRAIAAMAVTVMCKQFELGEKDREEQVARVEWFAGEMDPATESHASRAFIEAMHLFFEEGRKNTEAALRGLSN